MGGRRVGEGVTSLSDCVALAVGADVCLGGHPSMCLAAMVFEYRGNECVTEFFK